MFLAHEFVDLEHRPRLLSSSNSNNVIIFLIYVHTPKVLVTSSILISLFSSSWRRSLRNSAKMPDKTLLIFLGLEGLFVGTGALLLAIALLFDGKAIGGPMSVATNVLLNNCSLKGMYSRKEERNGS